MRKIQRVLPVVLLVAAGAVVVGGTLFSGIISFDKAVAALDSSKFFTVKDVAVKGVQRLDAAALIEKCEIGKVKKIYKVNSASVVSILTADPWVEKARCIKRWWGKVIIEVTERVPVAMMSTGTVFLIDKNGIVLPVERGESYSLPLVTGITPVADKKGTLRIDTLTMNHINRFITAVRSGDGEWFERISQMHMGKDGVIRCKVRNLPITVIMNHDTDQKQLRNLWYLLDVLRNRSDHVENIDLRYQNIAFVLEKDGSEQHGGRSAGN
jgi:hypothetical protein